MQNFLTNFDFPCLPCLLLLKTSIKIVRITYQLMVFSNPIIDSEKYEKVFYSLDVILHFITLPKNFVGFSALIGYFMHLIKSEIK